MLLSSFFILHIVVGGLNGQINTFSDIDLFSWGTQFQPAHSLELFKTSFTATLIECGQCKLFMDRSNNSSLYRLFCISV